MIDIKETLTIKEENNMDEYKVTIDQDRYEELIRYEHELMMLENAIYDNLELYTYSHDVDLSAYAGQDFYIAFHDVNYDTYEI